MFKLFERKKSKEIFLKTPANGEAVPLSQVKDPTFADEILGKGAAVIPSEGKIYAPVDGEIGTVFDTLHAISLTTEFGAEVLVHIGLDTVQLKGQYFKSHIKAGDHVKAGDLMISLDLEKVKEAGYDVITPVLICNSSNYTEVSIAKTGPVTTADDFIKIVK